MDGKGFQGVVCFRGLGSGFVPFGISKDSPTCGPCLVYWLQAEPAQ